MLLTKSVEVCWNNTSRKHYEKLGYIYTKQWDKFIVPVEHLSIGASALVDVTCDYCGVKKTIKYSSYIRQHDDKFGDCCVKCKEIKRKNTSMEKYGVEVALQLPEINKKRKQTNLKKYGCEHPTQNIEVVNKIKATCNERYGGNSSMSSDEVKQKYMQTCMERYGVPFASQNDEIKERTIKTLMHTLKDNGHIATSKPEREMVKLLTDIFGVENCFPSYIMDKIALDCLVFIDGKKIDFEYDGTFWHKGKEEKDRKRDYFLYSQGYSVIRIKGNYEIPTTEQIKDAVDFIINGNHHFAKIELDM